MLTNCLLTSKKRKNRDGESLLITVAYVYKNRIIEMKNSLSFSFSKDSIRKNNKQAFIMCYKTY